DEHDVSVRKLQCIMMHVRLVHVQLPETMRLPSLVRNSGQKHRTYAVILATLSQVPPAVLAQMDRTIDSIARQATISSIATFLGEVFAHRPTSHLSGPSRPSGGIAITIYLVPNYLFTFPA